MIGVFDSGSGGLTILSTLQDVLPDQQFIYYGDHLNSPYGDKSRPAVQKLVEEAIEVLFSKGCDLVITACNTACAVALKNIQRNWLPNHYPDEKRTTGNPRRVLGIVVPTVEAVTGQPWQDFQPFVSNTSGSWNELVAVFGTLHTTTSQVYPFEIHKRRRHIRVVQQAIAGLANAIDCDKSESLMQGLINEAVETVLDISDGEWPHVVLLACTHYPLVRHLFEYAMSSRVFVLDQRKIVASSLAAYLERHPCYKKSGTSQAFTSGDPKLADTIAQRFKLKVPKFLTL